MSKRREAIFEERYLHRLRAFPGAQELLQEMRERRLKLALASSAQPDELASALGGNRRPGCGRKHLVRMCRAQSPTLM